MLEVILLVSTALALALILRNPFVGVANGVLVAANLPSRMNDAAQPIDSIRHEGLVLVRGKIVAGQRVQQAPFSKRECVFCRVTLQERVSAPLVSLQSQGRWNPPTAGRWQPGWAWRTLAVVETAWPFYVRDASGQIVVHFDAARAEIFPAAVQGENGAVIRPSSEHDLLFREMLREHSSELISTNKPQLRYFEEILEDGMDVSVLAHAMIHDDRPASEDDSAAHYRQDERSFALTHPREGAVVVLRHF